MINKIASVAAAGIIAATAVMTAPMAGAATYNDNVNPVDLGATCSSVGATGQNAKVVRNYFDGSAGTWTISNYNDEPLPITRSITENKTKTFEIGASVSFPVLKVIQIQISSSYTDSSSYTVGETVGPYDLAPGKTAVMKAGWVMTDFEVQTAKCGSDHKWHGNGDITKANGPRERHVEISTRDNDDWKA